MDDASAVSWEGFPNFIPDALNHFRVRSQFHVRFMNFFRPDNCGEWNAVSTRTSQVGQNDTVPRDLDVDVQGHARPSYQRAGTWEWDVASAEAEPSSQLSVSPNIGVCQPVENQLFWPKCFSNGGYSHFRDNRPVPPQVGQFPPPAQFRHFGSSEFN
jgi:hypothetical protein